MSSSGALQARQHGASSFTSDCIWRSTTYVKCRKLMAAIAVSVAVSAMPPGQRRLALRTLLYILLGVVMDLRVGQSGCAIGSHHDALIYLD
jgi:hypothetical protein